MNRRLFLKSGLITLLAGVSATAAFAATGFIAAFGREQFLGVNLSDWSAQTLTLLAGRCAADSFFLLLNLSARHWFIVSAFVLLVGASAVVLRQVKLPALAAPAAECVLAVPLLVWLLMVIGNFEGPTIPLRGWILAPQWESPVREALNQLHLRAVDLKAAKTNTAAQADQAGGANPATEASPAASVLGAAAGENTPAQHSTAAPGVTRLGDYYYADRDDTPGVLLLEASSEAVGKLLSEYHYPLYKPSMARNLLYSQYGKAVAACLLAMLYILFSSQCPESKVWSDLLTVLRTGVVVASGVSTVMLPYVYGKLVDSTLFPNAIVTYLQPPTDAPGGTATLVSGEYPVISQTGTALSLLWVQRGGGHTRIIQVPVDKVVSLEFVAEVDALAKISRCISNPGNECQ